MRLEIPDEYFTKEELKNTPLRWQRFMQEWLAESKNFTFTTFPNEEKYDELIQHSSPFFSLCAHHLLPFAGTAHVGYIPKDKICGLSKLARVVNMFANRPQNQERITIQTANFLQKRLNPKGVMVVLEARHLCEEARGVKAIGATTRTSAVRGAFKRQEARQEFLSLIRRQVA